jgi:hypothetical protein
MENPKDEQNAAEEWFRNSKGDMLMDALAEEGERGQVLVAAAFLENMLVDCLRAKLKQCRGSKTAIDAVLDGRWAPISDFAAKIDLCRALGIITEESRETLHHLRKVRNCFAHSDFKIKLNDLPMPSKMHHAGPAIKECVAEFGFLKSYLTSRDGWKYEDDEGNKFPLWQVMLKGHEIIVCDPPSNHHVFLGVINYLFIELSSNRTLIGHPEKS